MGGIYRTVPVYIRGAQHVPPNYKKVRELMKYFVQDMNIKEFSSVPELAAWTHAEFVKIHPFQDGNGRIGRLILFKECLKYDIVPFIITDDLKMFYYRGIREWKTEPGYLTDTCLTAQDHFKALMDYFRIPYNPNA